VIILTRVLKVSKSAYYAWRSRERSRRAVEDEALLERIRAIHKDSGGTYGAPRVHAELRKAHGVRVGRKRVARLMRAAGLVGVHRRRRGHVKAGKDNEEAVQATRAFENHLNGDFTADAPDRRWVADITQHQTREGWLYLAVVLDLFQRAVVGWAMAERMTGELVVDALEMALTRRRPARGVLHHSDRGGQYRSLTLGQRLRDSGLIGSMSRPGRPADNAAMESFFASLQTELLDRRRWVSRSELQTAIFHYIEAFYNRKRRHSTLGYLSPHEFERRYNQQQAAT